MVSDSNIRLISPKPRRRWLKICGLLVLFGAGMFSGSALTLAVAVHRIEYAMHHPQVVATRLTVFLKRRLNLNATQADHVHAIISERQAALSKIRVSVTPQVMHQVELLHSQIDGELNDTQKQKWDEIYNRARERWLPEDVPTTQSSTDD